jgi:Rap1a immunity proteins
MITAAIISALFTGRFWLVAARARLPVLAWFGLIVGTLMTICLASCAARANDYVDGRQLLGMCSAPPGPQRVWCMGYVTGVAGAMGINPINGYSACIPRDATVADLVAIVVRLVPSYPSIGGYGAAGLVAHAFADVFPCPHA